MFCVCVNAHRIREQQSDRRHYFSAWLWRGLLGWYRRYGGNAVGLFVRLVLWLMVLLLSVLYIIFCFIRPCGKYLALFLSKCHWLFTLRKWWCAFTRPLSSFGPVFILTGLSVLRMPPLTQYTGFLKRCILLYPAISCTLSETWRLAVYAGASAIISATQILMYNTLIITNRIYCLRFSMRFKNFCNLFFCCCRK